MKDSNPPSIPLRLSDAFPDKIDYRDGKALTVYEGTSEIQSFVIADPVIGMKGS